MGASKDGFQADAVDGVRAGWKLRRCRFRPARVGLYLERAGTYPEVASGVPSIVASRLIHSVKPVPV